MSEDEINKLILFNGKVDAVDYEPDEEIDLKKVKFIASDGKVYQLVAGPEIEDLSILNGLKVIVLGQVQKEFSEQLTIVVAGFRSLPKADGESDTLIGSHRVKVRR